MVTGMCSRPDDDTKVPPLAEEMLACGEANVLCSALLKPPEMSVCVCLYPQRRPSEDKDYVSFAFSSNTPHSRSSTLESKCFCSQT